jgi:hypothetical protein
MPMPRQKPNKSRQDYETPEEFLGAVVRRFGSIEWDLAASAENSKAPGRNFIDEETDSLTVPWHRLPLASGWLWLNPPFGRCGKFAEKARDEMILGARVLMLAPASVGSNWFNEFVLPHAHVIGLRPRMTFVGERDPYPKDLMLAVFAYSLTGFSTWRWK